MKDQTVRVQIWKFIPLNQNKREKKAAIGKFPKPEGNELSDRKNTDECKKYALKTDTRQAFSEKFPSDAQR